MTLLWIAAALVGVVALVVLWEIVLCVWFFVWLRLPDSWVRKTKWKTHT